MMSLKFFADHCVPNLIIQSLQDLDPGYTVFRLRDHIPTDSSDSVVISKAQEFDSILVFLNGDFADIVTYPPARYKGIIAFQVKDHPEIIPLLLRRLKNYLSDHPDMNHYKGKLFLIQAHRIRIRE